MERREHPRKILDFEEFPLRADFFSGINHRFYGHIQNISPGGLCVMLLNCKTASPPHTKGVMTLIYQGKTIDIPAVVKWIDTPRHLIRYAGIETDGGSLYEKLKEIIPNLY